MMLLLPVRVLRPAVCLAILLPMVALSQTSPSRVVTAGKVIPARTSAGQSLARPIPLVPPSDPCKAALDELASLRMEAAAKAKEIERVRLLDPGLGAMMQTSISDLNTRMKIAEATVSRCDERERERRENEKLRAIQAHELQMVDLQHRNQKELLRYQQELVSPAPEAPPAEKDLFEIWADSLDASAQFNQGIRQLKSTEVQSQADGLRKIGGSIRRISPPK